MKETIRKILLDSGALAVGFSEAGAIDPAVDHDFRRWISEGNHGEMAYLERHANLRNHTDNVLAEAQTVISLAFTYKPEETRNPGLSVISSYAYGIDYHVRLREILNPAIDYLKKTYGGKWRICIDSAPVAERYYALKSGIGVKGMNGMVIIEGGGSFCFLVEILTTLKITPDESKPGTCSECNLCLQSCPTKALRGDGTMDARRCINYLTIEKKTDFTTSEKLLLKAGNGYLFGCDICQKICPHNDAANGKSLFPMLEDIKNLSSRNILEMGEENFKNKFKDSPLLYAGYQRLLRNARINLCDKTESNKENNL